MHETYRVAADRGPDAQLTLGLEVRLGSPVEIGALAPGDRFLLESAGVEGRVEALGHGSATVLLWREGRPRPARTTWALTTRVRPLRG